MIRAFEQVAPNQEVQVVTEHNPVQWGTRIALAIVATAFVIFCWYWLRIPEASILEHCAGVDDVVCSTDIVWAER